MENQAKTIAVELAAVAVFSAIMLAWGIGRQGIASGYVDPLLHAGAQDEAVYGQAAAAMVHTGHWLTPTFLGRLLLNKPPLLMWMGAVAMKLSGVGPTILRLPVIGAGVVSCCLIYFWLRRLQGLLPAVSGLLLLLGNALFQSMSRRFMTDIVLTLFVIAAMFAVAVDPRLERRSTSIVFGVLSGAAIMTKSAAGLLPLLILVACFFFIRSELRPPLERILMALGAAILVAAPWHLYQWFAHRDWFLAEYIRFQLLGSGITAPSRYSGESNLSFYAQRLLAMDPLLLLLWCLAIPGVAEAWKHGKDEFQVRLLTSWCICSSLMVLVFGTRIAYYMLPLIPAMLLISVRFSPLFRGRWAVIMCGVVTLAFAVKIWRGEPPWGLDYRKRAVPSAAALQNYARLRRTNELLIVSADDEFYSSVLDLPRVRYVYLGTADPTKTADFFHWLGVDLSPREYCELPALLPVYRQRFGAWNAPAQSSIGAMILGSAASDASGIVRCSPGGDFFLPDSLREQVREAARETHFATASDHGRFFLLSKQPTRRPEDEHAAGTLIATGDVAAVTASPEARIPRR